MNFKVTTDNFLTCHTLVNVLSNYFKCTVDVRYIGGKFDSGYVEYTIKFVPLEDGDNNVL